MNRLLLILLVASVAGCSRPAPKPKIGELLSERAQLRADLEIFERQKWFDRPSYPRMQEPPPDAWKASVRRWEEEVRRTRSSFESRITELDKLIEAEKVRTGFVTVDQSDSAVETKE